ncbi:type VII toxin-antitoxin system HepT family RNase toxin [Poseidonibacter sp.]|uniref:type VII toxin-antitoxin system HepT family RNase toxin n=1 Tax=Poseidonibacter sp. TaxID=2321188 RepID=UPI003C784359
MQHKIHNKISKLKYYLKLLHEYKPDCKEKFLSDPMYEGALLHYLYLVSDGCITLAEMMIKLKSLSTPQSYYEAIDTLGENDIIPKEFAYHFAKIASFRNFLAHDYEKIDYLVICDEVLDKLDEIDRYLKLIEEKI